ncbi:hypothetical protein LPJ74_002715 [Coemansia sp. RSA 1843]|nr:hypothetical protein LPJ74_002715 [Coemansia sp. RSA 1843]
MFPSTGLLSQIDCPYKDGCNRGTLCLFRHIQTAKPSTNVGTGGVQKRQGRVVNESGRQKEAASDAFVDIGSEEITLDDSKPSIAPSIVPTNLGRAAKEHNSYSLGNPKETLAAIETLPATAAAATTTTTITTAATHSRDTTAANSSKKDSKPGHVSEANKGNAAVAEKLRAEPIRKDTDAEDNTPNSKKNSVEDWRTRTLNYDPESPGYDRKAEREAAVPQLKAIVGDKIGYSRRQRALEILYDHYKRIPDILKTMKETPSVAAMHAVESERNVYDSSVAGTYHGKLLVCLKELKQKAQA